MSHTQTINSHLETSWFSPYSVIDCNKQSFASKRAQRLWEERLNAERRYDEYLSALQAKLQEITENMTGKDETDPQVAIANNLAIVIEEVEKIKVRTYDDYLNTDFHSPISVTY